MTFPVVKFTCYLLISYVTAGGINDFLDHSGKPGTQHGREIGDPNYYATNADVSHLPFITGYKATSGTFRFLSVVEQTALLIGEGKHGLWRVQDNGMIREYRKKGKQGIKDSVNPNDLNLDNNIISIIRDNYAPYIPEEGWSGYKYPDDRISDGTYDGLKDYLNYIDLSIYHPKYGGKYNSHVPIDLPHWYCTMSQNDYPYENNSWHFARAQPQANKIGPLGVRAGLDIREHFVNVLRINFFPDASVWANVGTGNKATDERVKDINEVKNRAQTVSYKPIDLTKTNYEIYLCERIFFNFRYLYLILVMENKNQPSEFSYVRPNGPYWNGIRTQGHNISSLNTKPNYFPKIDVENFVNEQNSSFNTLLGLAIYGIHHPNRRKFGMSGGACPSRGGDWGRYPWSNSGAGWPTNYEEITPLCDAVVIDIKMWANLWLDTWKDEAFALGNSGFNGALTINYTADANIYGKYTDPYLQNEVNPYLLDLTTSGEIVNVADKKPLPLVFKIKYPKAGKMQSYNTVDIFKSNETCAAGTGTTKVNIEVLTEEPKPEIETTKSTKVTAIREPNPESNPDYGDTPVGNIENKQNVIDYQNTPIPETAEYKTVTVKEDSDIPDWGIAVLVLLSLILVVNLLIAVTYFCFVCADRHKSVEEAKEMSQPTSKRGIDNPALQG